MRNDVRDIRRLLRKQAGEPDEEKSGSGGWGLIAVIITAIIVAIFLAGLLSE